MSTLHRHTDVGTTIDDGRPDPGQPGDQRTGPQGAGRAADRVRPHLPVGLLRQAARPSASPPARSPTPQGAKTGIDFFSKDAWINGGNPTLGFLKFGASGPFKGFYNSIAGDAWVNWAFMLGLLFIGVTLTFGIAIRLGAVAGFVMYLMMWSVALWPANNPVIDDHILGAISMAVLGLTLAGDTWGLGKAWSRQHLVANHPVLR